MRRKTRRVSVSRIHNSLTFPELVVRVFVGAMCLAGIGFVASRFYDAVRLHIKQRALIASVGNEVSESQTLQKPVAEKLVIELPASKREASISADSSGAKNTVSGSVIPTAGSAASTSHVSSNPAVSTVAVPQTGEKDDRASVAVTRNDSESKLDGKMSSDESPLGMDQNSRMAPRLLPDSPATRKPVTAGDAFALPTFEVTDLILGRSYDPLEQYKGKVIVLDFWASWCAPCLEEMQMLQKTVGDYDASQFQLIAVNTEESKRVVEWAIESHGIKSRVALDLEGAAASVFGVEALPTLVLLDQTGTVQRIHVGLEDGLATRLRGEIDQLLSGETLAVEEDVASRLALANMKIPEDSKVAMQTDAGSLPNHDTLSDIVLANGSVYSVGEHLAEVERRFDRFLLRSSDAGNTRLTSLTYPETGQPSLLFSQRGEKLHGPLMSFHENGKRQSFIQYSFGKRIAALVMWDTAGRPLVMEEYRNGRKDGVRAIFKSCGGECTTAHLWVAEEWRGGKLLATHVGIEGEEIVRNEVALNTKSVMMPAMEEEYRLANQEFSGYEERLSVDEEKLKKLVSDHYKQLKRQFHAQANARLIASGARTHSFTSMVSNGISGAAAQRSMFSGPSMRTRNCGSS